MIYDIILIGIVLLFIVIGAVRGLAKTVIGLGVMFVSWLAASWLGKLIATWLYAGVFGPKVTTSVSQAADKISSGAVQTVDEVTAQFPGWLKGALSMSGKALPTDASQLTADFSQTAADTVNSVVQPIIIGAISILLTIVLFIVIRLVLRVLVMKPLLGVFKLPVINAFNRVLGGLLGAAEGVVLVWVLAYLLRLLLPHIASQTTILNESTIYNSFIFYHFYSGNIFTYLASWIKF